MATEGQLAVAARVDPRSGDARGAAREAGGPDDQGPAAELVGQPDPERVTSDAGMDDLPDRLVLEDRRALGGRARGRGRPGADPAGLVARRCR
jgi:hypothetical protein